MKVKYCKPRKQRIKKGSIKVNNRRIPNFIRLVCEDDLVWSYDLENWFDVNRYRDIKIGCHSGFNSNIRNLKQAIRHIKKHKEIPKGTRFTLESAFEGYDIYITK